MGHKQHLWGTAVLAEVSLEASKTGEKKSRIYEGNFISDFCTLAHSAPRLVGPMVLLFLCVFFYLHHPFAAL